MEFLSGAGQEPESVGRIEAQTGKSSRAFRTISEVADSLGLPQHVLRFWETRFPQIKPTKLRGGRRYYRPEDIALITTIKDLLYRQGYTIEGARKAIGKDLPSASCAPATSSLSEKQLDQLTVVRQELITLRDMLKKQLY
jgi:DNA-binding transcriptional MerR regulator